MVGATLSALRRAALLARDLHAAMRILNVKAVPYPLPLGHRPTGANVLARNISTLAEGQPIPTRVAICFGRDVADSLLQSLSPNSLVVIGAKTGWWPTKEQRSAKQLSRHGQHQGIFVSEGSSSL